MIDSDKFIFIPHYIRSERKLPERYCTKDYYQKIQPIGDIHKKLLIVNVLLAGLTSIFAFFHIINSVT